MTFSPDHRALHPPQEECEGCRVSAASGAMGREFPPVKAAGVPPLRTDLVFQPGTNRK